jgi:carboxylesterase type B
MLALSIGAASALAVLAAPAAAAAAAAAPVTANLPVAGPVVGSQLDMAEAFLGIPFAEPPVGPLRWASPKPTAPFGVPFQATKFAAGCVQSCDLPIGCPTAAQGMSEDCLYLNVFAPSGAAGSAATRPVMLFFPGGRFEQGTAGTELYDGRFIANTTGVVVVTTNYRLNVFGYLRASTIGGGNWGLEDQRLAMEWVRANVAGFGGNATDVTIFGQSAGGTSTATHLISPQSQPLFTKAIVESNPWTLILKTPAEAEKIAKKFSKDLGCGKAEDPACLRGKSSAEVLAAAKQAQGGLNLLNPLLSFYPWTPVVDGDQVPGEPLDVLGSGKVPAKPVLMGTVKQEGIMFIWEAVPKNMSRIDFGLIVDAVFKFKAPGVHKLYPGLPDGADNRPQLSKLATDYIMACSERAALRGFSGQGQGAWQYQFDHVFSYSKAAWGPNYAFCDDAVCHGEELSSVFGTASLLGATMGKTIVPTAGENTLAHQMIGYWGNFATTGDPNRGPVSGLPNWPQYSKANDQTLIFDVPMLRVEPNFKKDQCDFFDTVYNV